MGLIGGSDKLTLPCTGDKAGNGIGCLAVWAVARRWKPGGGGLLQNVGEALVI